MRLRWLGKHTNAAATTGPAMGPRPASSTPMIYLIYFQSFVREHSFAIISSKWQAARREWQALCQDKSLPKWPAWRADLTYIHLQLDSVRRPSSISRLLTRDWRVGLMWHASETTTQVCNKATRLLRKWTLQERIQVVWDPASYPLQSNVVRAIIDGRRWHRLSNLGDQRGNRLDHTIHLPTAPDQLELLSSMTSKYVTHWPKHGHWYWCSTINNFLHLITSHSLKSEV